MSCFHFPHVTIQVTFCQSQLQPSRGFLFSWFSCILLLYWSITVLYLSEKMLWSYFLQHGWLAKLYNHKMIILIIYINECRYQYNTGSAIPPAPDHLTAEVKKMLYKSIFKNTKQQRQRQWASHSNWLCEQIFFLREVTGLDMLCETVICSPLENPVMWAEITIAYWSLPSWWSRFPNLLARFWVLFACLDTTTIV